MIDTNEHIDSAPRTFRSSTTFANLAAALAKAQGEIEGAKKDAENPAFKRANGKASKYADLASVWDAIRAPLSKNELAVLQFPREGHGGVEVETVLVHSSGEWMSESLLVPVDKENAHGVGSAITYCRRFALAAIVGVAPEDDDGNAAAAATPKARDKNWDATPNGITHPEPAASTKARSKLATEALHDLEAAAGLGTESLRVGWESISPSIKKELAGEKDRLKEMAAQCDSGEPLVAQA